MRKTKISPLSAFGTAKRWNIDLQLFAAGAPGTAAEPAADAAAAARSISAFAGDGRSGGRADGAYGGKAAADGACRAQTPHAAPAEAAAKSHDAAPDASGGPEARRETAAPHPDSADSGAELSRAQRRQAAAAGTWHRADPLAAVRYGKPEAPGRDAAAPQHAADQTETAEPDKNTAFERLIRGEYKEQFAARTQHIIDQRFREVKAQQAQAARAAETLTRLAQHYGVSAADREALLRAAGAEETSAADRFAAAHGAETGADAQVKAGAEKAPAPNAAENPAPAAGEAEPDDGRAPAGEAEDAVRHDARTDVSAAQAADAAAREIARHWTQDGRALAAVYPNFSLEKAVEEPDFARLLAGGVSVRRAYEACHLDELLGGAMQYAVDRASEGFAARAAERAARPAENGTTPHAGAVLKTDVSSLTRADRDEIERRVAHGERIRF